MQSNSEHKGVHNIFDLHRDETERSTDLIKIKAEYRKKIHTI